MIVSGIKFKKTNKVYYFDGDGLILKEDDDVIVETSYGKEVAKVVFASKDVSEDEIVPPLKKILRVMDREDYITLEENTKLAAEALERCETKVLEHGLDMKLISSDYTFDKSKLLFYFTSDGRVDFRELVRDLASEFRTRIELRQIGVRDEFKMAATLGMCGRTTCCKTHLSNFNPVSIKMAKNQNLSLNPTKISGVCGRLMCCLQYEDENYKILNKDLPRPGDKVKILESGKTGEVIHVNILRQSAKIVIRDKDDVEIVNKKTNEFKILSNKEKSQGKGKHKEGVKTHKKEHINKEVHTKVNKKGKKRDKKHDRHK